MGIENLIKNSDWMQGTASLPSYFSGTGPISYDEFSLNGFRSCSLSMGDRTTAVDGYDLFLDVRGKAAIVFGLTIRAIEVTEVCYVCDLYHSNQDMFAVLKQNVTRQITYEFQNVDVRFLLPRGTSYVKLYWKFIDKVTACTFMAPMAYLE